jgi:type II secretory pathway predicted ATPase ExeA
MYHDFYHLKHNPFEAEPNPEFLFLSRSHKMVFHALIRGMEESRSLMSLTGGPGLGKTIILRAVQARIQQQLSQTVCFISARTAPPQILTTVCQECGLADVPDHPTTQLHELRQLLWQGQHNGWRVILMIDDAHLLPELTWKSLLPLLEWQNPQEKPLLPVILTALPAWQQQCKQPLLRPLQARQAVQVTLRPLSTAESLEYIRHRLTRVLMPEDALFTAGAIKCILRAARGNPHELNMLCDSILAAGAMQRQKPVSAAVAQEVITDGQVAYTTTVGEWGKTFLAGLLLGTILWLGGQMIWRAGIAQNLWGRFFGPPGLPQNAPLLPAPDFAPQPESSTPVYPDPQP